MVYLIDFILFLAKTATLLIGFVVAILFLVSLRSNNAQSGGKIEFKDIGDHFEQIKEGFLEFKNDESDSKRDEKKSESAEKAPLANSENYAAEDGALDPDAVTAEKSSTKKEAISAKKFWQFWKKEEAPKVEQKEKTLYVLEFDGDVHAEEVKNLREEVSALLHIANKNDEVLLKLTSPGGAVNSYGLAASQLVRIRDKGLNLTVAVDEVAASGGYLMACVANHIVAAPFAIVGSIGVVAELPNFHKVLEKYNIDYEQFTAGEYKRTVTMFGENTDEAKAKFKDELTEIHLVFKDFVHQYRPSLDIQTIATGEYWLAVKALEFGLVDELKTSDAYILDAIKDKNVYSIKYIEKTTVRQGISRFLTRIMKRVPF
ncbi:protease SohB [Ignatzschineria rhizosphaerae]|uniref:Protease SohB n=1 Tax=Ignatzschineria rhizosphaerae TaxID=2923279 RepID=A0ABY3X417_9GAMM|nr:protease SohB [Ignatzschineria rhizosphaerae]UNM97633.1 protease SohB [Ignatzschineria rhizosphaerae]